MWQCAEVKSLAGFTPTVAAARSRDLVCPCSVSGANWLQIFARIQTWNGAKKTNRTLFRCNRGRRSVWTGSMESWSQSSVMRIGSRETHTICASVSPTLHLASPPQVKIPPFQYYAPKLAHGNLPLQKLLNRPQAHMAEWRKSSHSVRAEGEHRLMTDLNVCKSP